jgi:hypothetical protein
MTESVLLPFKDKIVYDGLITSYHISFGPGIRRSLNESFKEAKRRHGILTSLPMSDEMLPQKVPKARPVPKPPSREKKDEVLHVIIGMTDQFCHDYLNDEYAVLCRKMAVNLARKRPSPLVSGKPTTWACAIVRTIGMVNFLGDRSQKPYMKMTDVDKAFGIGESTLSSKSASTRKMLKIHQFDHEWMLRSRMDRNPLIWMLTVNGFMMDIRQCPREAQVVAFEKGLIPYIPADRTREED